MGKIINISEEQINRIYAQIVAAATSLNQISRETVSPDTNAVIISNIHDLWEIADNVRNLTTYPDHECKLLDRSAYI